MNVVIIGDSHVEAMGPQLTQKLPTVGVRVMGYTTRRGWSTDRYNGRGDLARLVTRPEHGGSGTPDAVVVSLGGNGRPRSKSSYRSILQRAVNKIRESGVQRIVWVGPATSVAERSAAAADAHRRHEQNAEWQRELLPQMGVTWIDSRPMTRSGHAPDGVHFTFREGYPRWADQLKHEIAHALAGPAPSGGAPSGGKPGPGRPAGGMPLKGSAASFWVPVAILTVATGIFLGTIFLVRPRPAY